jgi:rhodanese-related sulfurtransferase
MWVMLFVMSGAMLLRPLIAQGISGVAELSTFDATRLINSKDGILIDIRNTEEFNAGHILGARSIPLTKLSDDSAGLMKNKSKPLIVYCQVGRQSAGAVKILTAKGFEQVYALKGGLAAWQQAGLPMQRQ